MRSLRLVLALGMVAAILVATIASPAQSSASSLYSSSDHATNATQPDPVLLWNKIAVQTVWDLPPELGTHATALMHLAQFEAVNAIEGGYEPYLGGITAPHGASPQAAAISAAHHVLSSLFPASTSDLDAARAAQLALIQDGRAKAEGISVGEAAAAAILAARADDGSANPNVPYTPGTAPGNWRPTPPDYRSAVFTNWGRVTPFGIRSGSQFRAPPPPALNSAEYARALNEVKALGRQDSTVRSQLQTDKAIFYDDDLFLFSQAARELSLKQHKTLAENAQIFALLSMAHADGMVSAFYSKYYYNFWRPVTAIREANTDGNPRTVADPSWLPLLGTTPPYPSYPSNYGTAANALRVVLEQAYGKRGLSITLVREDTTAPDLTLHYTAFSQMTDDVANARIDGGIHYRFDQEAAARLGAQVGQWIVQHNLRPMRGQHR